MPEAANFTFNNITYAVKDATARAEIQDINVALGRSDETNYRPFGLFYANYTGPNIRASIRQSADVIAKYDVAVFAYAPNLESSCPADDMAIIQLAKTINPTLRIYSYITASSDHNGYTLNADGSWENSPAQQANVERIYNRHELIQYFHDLKHVGGVRTGQYDVDGYEIMEGGFAFDGAFLDEFGADVSTDAKHYQGGKDGSGNWRWDTAADKWNDIVAEAHRCGCNLINNTWESTQMLAECTELTSDDMVLIETCEFMGDENVENDTDFYWTTYASEKRIFDFVNSEYYALRKPKVVSYSTLNVNASAELKRRAFTWAVYNTLAMGGHYVYVSGTEGLQMPDETRMFKVPENGVYTYTHEEKGRYKLTVNGHTVETIRENTDAVSLATAENFARVYIKIDGNIIQNAFTSAPVLEYDLSARMSSVENNVADALANTKKNASEYVRLQIDDWTTTVTPSDFENLLPRQFNTVSAINMAVTGEATYDVTATVANGWGWANHSFSAETLAPFLGKTLEFGCSSITTTGFSDFGNAEVTGAVLMFVQVDNTKYCIQKNTNNASATGNTSGINIQVTIPANAAAMTVGWQCYGVTDGVSFAVYDLYLADIHSVDEASAKKFFTNVFPINANNVSAVNPVLTSRTDALGHRVFDVNGNVTYDWGVWRQDFTGTALEPFKGHTLELGCTNYKIYNADTTVYTGADLPLILGAAWNTTNKLFPTTNNASSVGNTTGLCIQYTVPTDAEQFSVGWQGGASINGLTFEVEGLYLYDLDEDNVIIRGRDLANSWLRICRVTEAMLVADPTLLGNCLYITDAGNMFITDYSGTRTNIITH